MSNQRFVAACACCVVCLLAFLTGCVHQARYIEGTNFEVGMVVPGTDGALSLDIISYTGGGKLAATKDNGIYITRDAFSFTDAFGVYSSSNRVVSTARIYPAVTTNGACKCECSSK